MVGPVEEVGCDLHGARVGVQLLVLGARLPYTMFGDCRGPHASVQSCL
jgi:hypothetical protein